MAIEKVLLGAWCEGGVLAKGGCGKADQCIIRPRVPCTDSAFDIHPFTITDPRHYAFQEIAQGLSTSPEGQLARERVILAD